MGQMPFLLAAGNDAPDFLQPDWRILLVLGELLGAALLGGLVAQKLRLPRVTAYLIVGLLLGPRVFNVTSEEELHSLDMVGKLAMALVLFNMGTNFTLERLRRNMRRALRLSGGELGLTFLLVNLGMLFIGQPMQVAILLGALALATAPATTILVLKENNSEGPVTELTTTLVVFNNLAAVVIFELLLLMVTSLLGDAQAEPANEIFNLFRDLLGSAMVGIAGGLIISFACALMNQARWFVLLIAASTYILGTAESLQFPYLLTFLAMGMTVANASEQAKEIAGQLDRFTGLVCVVFFVIHGAELKIDLLLDPANASLLIIAVVYILCRSAGKYFGIYFAAKSERDGQQVKRWLGTTLISQAGAAIALATIAKSALGEPLGDRIQLIILSTVVFFELVGPILIQMAVRNAGEVPLSHAIHHATSTPFDELRYLVNRILVAFGFSPWESRAPEGITIDQVMRRNIKGVPASATFDEVIDYIEHSNDNSYAVVGDGGALVGIIRYEDLRDALFDPELGKLVRAEDLSVPCPYVLYTDDTLPKTREYLQAGADDCMFVISRDELPRLLGVVKRRDVLRFYAKTMSDGGLKMSSDH